ncbi:pyruvate ferredoxin oxidoreductase, alpha subunit [Acidothermus cellulolyticus 11B]|jgi:pyruvate ferredoxin oxidoreductase alpha subunit|uniref:Pyruvate ferredoxin oxidoreductase, alpha subunit n=1 Tax=Acidothermus cellulolyticus (strain ATCC 43068 / DSM 8971 / 11B) TaxID=351607 RepID=A0LSR4_ACIC1|nr:2-ketoisovalerate ferredoxin oxidoreductase subunit alpha [Acidothermus cellulolyticus]ABK52474.1 pyruvate ferredoxin oxidoreductase, alpha subunit [Acidothermus cellulolyticus 11B]
MRSQREASRAIAEVVGRCRPQVVPAYPITPQTHIVEALGAMIRAGTLSPCVFLTVESEFAAMSAAIGASFAGSRTYTATASQGLLYMAEALFNASGLGAPIVMTVANRAVGAPINIWNDQSDAMSLRDCGWIQLYAPDNQAAVDLHVLAFRVAEALSLPVMVCMDGFVLTHAFEPLAVPTQAQVDNFLPPFRPRQVLDPGDPVTIGAMVGPEAFTEVKYLSAQRLDAAVNVFEWFAQEYAEITGRRYHAVESYRIEHADTVVVALGSAAGTLYELADAVPGVGVLVITMYRPFPARVVRGLLAAARRVIVLERAFAPGAGGIVTADVRAAVAGTSAMVHTVIGGLGGRPIRLASLRAVVTADALPDIHFLDLREDVVRREWERDPTVSAMEVRHVR